MNCPKKSAGKFISMPAADKPPLRARFAYAENPDSPSDFYLESPERRRRIQAVTVVAIIVGLVYLVWRATSTFNPESSILSWFLFLLELWGFIGFLGFAHSTWDLHHVGRPRPVADTDAKVAVLIATYNEPAEILLPTVAAAVSLRPAHETWVLDDGCRDWVREMAESLGAIYLGREESTHAKAGNINHALQFVDADLVGILDADHVPSPEFLTNTLGYFDAVEDLALVQTPQDFYNADSFEHVDDYLEERLFYRVLQPGKNRWNSAFWCGTSAVLRTDALRSVGGVATDSVSEDLLTTMRLHADGWKTVFHNEPLAHGIAPGGYLEYKVQRERWGSGSMEVLRSENPMVKPGLSIPQRIGYMISLTGWFESWRLVGFLLLPIIVLLSGTFPLSADPKMVLLMFGASFASQMYALKLLGRGQSHPLWTIVFDIIRLGISLVATLRLIVPDGSGFKVTPKGRTGDERTRTEPPALQVAIGLMSIIALLWFAASAAGATTTEYASVWAASFVALVLIVDIGLIALAIGRISDKQFSSERRGGWRIDEPAPAMLEGRRCMIESIGIGGGRVRADSAHRFLSDAPLTLSLPLDGRTDMAVTAVRANFNNDENEFSFVFLPGQWREKAALSRILVLRRLQLMGVAVSMRNVDSADLTGVSSNAQVAQSAAWIPPTSRYLPRILAERIRGSRSARRDHTDENQPDFHEQAPRNIA